MGVRQFVPDLLHLKARALLALERADAAYACLDEARALAEALGSRRSLWPVLAALSRLEAARGNPTAAADLRRQAAEIVAYIAEHAGRPELRAAFLGLPEVRAVVEPG
jgi:hypothetical protein